MGSWNKTCGLSNLPITYGTPVRVFVLERVTDTVDQCYSTCLYRPLLLSFHSVYNDYGAGEDSGGPFLDLIMDGLKNRLVEVEQGENPYHDIPVTRAAWNLELFWKATHKNRLKIKSAYGKETDVSFTMLHNDVILNIFQNWTREEYKDGVYTTYKIDQLLEAIPDIIARAQKELSRYDADLAPYMAKFERLYKWEEHTIASPWLRVDYRYSQIVDIERTFFELVQQGDNLRAALLLSEFFKAVWIDAFMDSVRKLWTPGGFEGSQSFDRDSFRFLTATINSVLDQEDADE